MQNYLSFDSKLGKIYISGDEKCVKGVWFAEQKFFPKPELLGEESDNNPILTKAKEEILQYLSGKITHFDVPLCPKGTDFRLLIWDILQSIQYGKTMTYGEIAAIAAQKMNRKTMSAQAVGNAVGHNPISILIPCHRVVGSDGSLTGYAGGIARKAALLALETGVNSNG